LINPRQVRILVVDDEREIRELLAARFSIFGFQALTAPSGNKAWQEICADSSIKMVVTDLTMADGSGEELLLKCKQAHPEFPKVFVITGQTQFTPENLLALGAEGFIHKPFDARTLLNTVRNALLSLEERLRYPPYTVPAGSVSMKFKSLEEAFESGNFALGRGGCFVTSKQNLPPEGGLVALDIDLGDFCLNGIAVVRWRRSDDKRRFNAGLEFLHLQPDNIKGLKSWVDAVQPKTFVPSPQIAISMPSTAKLQSTG
jgi:DNA-binding response OmpR family regulator